MGGVTTPDKPDASRGKPRREWKPTWLNAYAKHGTVTAACEAAGIHRSTAYEARERDAEFAAQWEQAENETTELLEKTAVQRALDGSDRLMEFMLKARRPARYRENLKVDHGGSIAVSSATDEKIADALKEANAEIDRLTGRLAEMADRGEAALPGPEAGAGVAASS